MSHFGEGCITPHYMPFVGISKTKCAILWQFFNDLSLVKRILSSLDVQMLEKISKHYFPWTCVMPRFLTIYKNTGVTGLWRGHCATGLVIFETSDLVMYRTSRVRMIFLCAKSCEIYQRRRSPSTCRLCLWKMMGVCVAMLSIQARQLPLGIFMISGHSSHSTTHIFPDFLRLPWCRLSQSRRQPTPLLIGRVCGLRGKHQRIMMDFHRIESNSPKFRLTTINLWKMQRFPLVIFLLWCEILSLIQRAWQCLPCLWTCQVPPMDLRQHSGLTWRSWNHGCPHGKWMDVMSVVIFS